MMSQQHAIDVRKVIENSTQVKTLQELEKEGRRAVKVVRAAKISELIEKAVENVIAERSMRVVEEEKSALGIVGKYAPNSDKKSEFRTGLTIISDAISRKM